MILEQGLWQKQFGIIFPIDSDATISYTKDVYQHEEVETGIFVKGGLSDD